MKEKIGFIGIGQAGGNIVELLDKQGYKTIAINTSKEDLELVDIDDTKKYIVPGSSGCNHDRQKSIQYAKEHYKEILDKIDVNLKGCDVIIPVFAAGGGTGSGMGIVITEILTIQTNKIIGAVCILPRLDEPIKVQLNAYNCYTKLTSLRGIGSIFTIDNSKGEGITRPKTYKTEINQKFVEDFIRLVELPKYTSVQGNIDEAEISEMLKTRGNTIVTTYKNQSEIGNSLKNSIYADMEQDKKMMYIALSLHEELDINLLESNVGVPYDMFINHNENDFTTIVLSGLSFAKTRTEIMKRKLENNKEHIKDLIENTVMNQVENNLEWISAGDIKIEPSEIVDFESIFKEY